MKYEGDYAYGKKEGQGRYEWQDGSYYEGDFIDSKFHGQGTYYFAETERTYVGEFEGGVF